MHVSRRYTHGLRQQSARRGSDFDWAYDGGRAHRKMAGERRYPACLELAKTGWYELDGVIRAGC